MTNPLCDPYFILAKVYQGGKYLKQAIAETPVEPLNKARTVKICYGVLEKDIYLAHIIAANTKKPPKSAVKIILKTALYMLEFMDKHDYMVVDCAVELIKKLGKDGASGFVNAFLRSYKIPPLPEKTDERISLETSAPLWLVKRLRRSYKSEASDILSAPSKGVCVRYKDCGICTGEQNLTAPLKEEQSSVKEQPPVKEINPVKEQNPVKEEQCIATPFKNVFIYPNFIRGDGFFNGEYTFQSVGSVAICHAISPCERLLDACAAPGGKSVLLSEKCKSVTSCELHPHRLELINAYAKRMGAENVTAVLADSTVFNPEYENAFDGVLCDVPCSGTGVINENPDIKLFRSEEDIQSLNTTQLAILENCSRYVREGGNLYYSTCSVLPEENDSIVYSFLQKHPEYTLNIPSSPLEHRTTKFGLQFLPHISLGAGFFMTSFIKNSKPDR